MPIFSIKQNNLEKIKEISFKNEKEIQVYTEKNLAKIFGLDFIKTEFSVGDLRIDTLAFDKESKSFVIIEYKKDKNFSVIDQGYAYLSLLLSKKADFILEYNENNDTHLKRNEVDWSQSKVMFVAPQFTKYQRKAIGFNDLPMELWEVSKYSNNTILFNQLKSPESSVSITKIGKKDSLVQKVGREVRLYKEEDHINDKPESIVKLYEELKNRILNIGDNIEIRPRKDYIGFIANTNFVDIHPKKSKITIWINLKKGELDDPKKLARDMSTIGHHGNGDYEISFNPEDDIDYMMVLVKQSYKKHSL